MAGSKSDYLENKLLDHVLGGGDFARPATIYVALFTVAPNDSTGGTEASGNGYARASVPNDATHWPASSGGTKKNGTRIVFPQASGGNWGTIVGAALYDAASGGNRLYWCSFTGVAINNGDTANFPANSITITED